MELRKGRHVVYILHAHLIFITKYRGKVFTNEHLNKLKEMMDDICRNHQATLTEFNGESDHVHLLINYHPATSLSKLTNTLKGITSREMKRHFPELNQVAWRKKCPLVSKLLCWFGRWRSYRGIAPIYRATKQTALNSLSPLQVRGYSLVIKSSARFERVYLV